MDLNKIRKDFPLLLQDVYKKPLVYLDNGATTQKPQQVIDAELEMYNVLNSNIHRGVHYLSNCSTDKFEEARRKVKEFINASSDKEIVFTAGTTASINTVAFSLGEYCIESGDEIILSEMEHHSNIVPWQMLCERKGAKLKIIPVLDNGELDIDAYGKLLSDKTKIVSVTHVSNTLGTINPISKITEMAHEKGAYVVIDGAQGIQHGQLNVKDVDCDFYVFSGHKIFAPTGIGVMYGKEEILNRIPPYQGGGDMIDTVTFEKTTYAELPFKFEAGTANYIGAVGLGAAIDYIVSLGVDDIAEQEQELLDYATNKLSSIDGLKIYGTSDNKVSTISFLLDGIHHLDTGMILDKLGIAVRTGHHCTQPLTKRFGIDGTVRASFAFYNTKEEVDALYDGLLKVKELFG
ncbi:MAG: cysteine desulfurase [Bacteroidales bacterium]|nr:cysteine desulfurase [Bacteroidales bacterium]